MFEIYEDCGKKLGQKVTGQILLLSLILNTVVSTGDYM